MQKVIKKVVGIDVSQKTLDVQMGILYDTFESILYTHRVLVNSEKGFTRLLELISKDLGTLENVEIVIEATGVYHEKLAHFVHANGLKISVVLPNKISNYMKTLVVKTITDKTCAEALTRFGLERKLDYWNPPKRVYKDLRQLVREREQIVLERSTIKNQLHAETSSAYPFKSTINRLEERIKFLNKQEKEIKADIDLIVSTNEDLKHEVKIITSAPGIGQLTAVTILAETNGFELIKNKKQLVSYAGLDVREKSSGTSVRGKSRISKKGNKNLRKAMHLPALTAIKWDQKYKNVYARQTQKHGIKMKSIVAVQRRLLELTYVLFKNKNIYDKDYEKNSAQKNLCAIQTGLNPS